MKRCSKLLLIALLLAPLAACKNFAFPGVHKIDIEQGNVVTQKMIDQLLPGMTKRQVQFILGTPLIIDTFNANRWDYYHSLDDRKNPKQVKRFSVFFDGDKLVRTSGDFAPGSATVQGQAPATAVE